MLNSGRRQPWIALQEKKRKKKLEVGNVGINVGGRAASRAIASEAREGGERHEKLVGTLQKSGTRGKLLKCEGSFSRTEGFLWEKGVCRC